jgi:hypothetical protein
MSPLMIEMLLHLHCRRDPYDHRSGQAQIAAFEWFRREQLIEPCSPADGCLLFGVYYRTTDRGAALVDKLCNTPLPVAVWT